MSNPMDVWEFETNMENRSEMVIRVLEGLGLGLRDINRRVDALQQQQDDAEEQAEGLRAFNGAIERGMRHHHGG